MASNGALGRISLLHLNEPQHGPGHQDSYLPRPGPHSYVSSVMSCMSWSTHIRIINRLETTTVSALPWIDVGMIGKQAILAPLDERISHARIPISSSCLLLTIYHCIAIAFLTALNTPARQAAMPHCPAACTNVLQFATANTTIFVFLS
jgi:hypothetical protein